MKNGCGRLHVVSLGFAIGLVSALYILLLGISASMSGFGMEVVKMSGTMYIGYAPTIVGSLIGAIWAFVDGFVCGVLIAFFYNLCCRCCCGWCGKSCDDKGGPKVVS